MKSFFSERIVNVWNFLPADTVDFSLLSAFKRTVELTDISTFLKVRMSVIVFELLVRFTRHIYLFVYFR